MGMSKRSGLVGGSLLVVGLAGVPVFAGSSHRDLIVRFRAPLDSQEAPLQLLRGAYAMDGGVEPAFESPQVINSNQGLVRLRFSDAESAARWLPKLEGARTIASVSPNLTYTTQLKLRLHEESHATRAPRAFVSPLQQLQDLAASVAGDAAGDASEGLGFKIPHSKRIPSVKLPGHEQTGADPDVNADWGMEAIRAPLLKSAGTPTIAAVIDTGVDYNHEDLISGMWRKSGNPKEVGYDFAHNKAKPYDVRQYDIPGYIECMQNKACAESDVLQRQYMANPGHGTHCAGHVGAVANNAKGMRGVASAQVMALKFFYDVGEELAGAGDDAAAIQAIDYAIANGARVINASWGGRAPRKLAMRSELRDALARARAAGVLFIAASGNDGINQDADREPAFPAAYTDFDNMIVVGAADARGTLADFSNYGAQSVHLAAPGVKIFSTTVGNKYEDVIARFTDPQGKVQVMDWDGTSMAAPYVAGAAALLWSQVPDATYLQLKQALLDSARKVPALSGKVITGGMLDVQAALARLKRIVRS